MIDTRSGTLSIHGAVVKPKMDLDEYKRTKAFELSEILRNQSGHCSIYTVMTYKEKYELSVTMYFLERKLKWCSVRVINNGILESWDGWSKEKCLKVKKLHDEFLKEVIGHRAPWEYEWGEVVSEYDAKSADSSIVITYNETFGNIKKT